MPSISLHLLYSSLQAMGLTKTSWICIFFCIVHTCCLDATSVVIQVDEQRDYEVLDLFFNMGILEEEYGYVLEGIKPISARQFYPLDAFPMKDLVYSENEFKKSLLVREAIAVWNRVCSQQDRFALKAVPVINYEAEACGFEVQFINLSKLRNTISENIHLFRYILGPNTEIDELVNRLAYSSERFEDILKNDLTLVGIVLGFGAYNSIVGGRLETLHRLSISSDFAPGLSKSQLLQDEDRYWRYGIYYLAYAGGDSLFFEQDSEKMHQNIEISAFQKEILSLESKAEPIPSTLFEKPRFIFGAFKGDHSNPVLFRSLQKAQKNILSLLKAPHHLDKILEQIGGKKPRITCKKSSVDLKQAMCKRMADGGDSKDEDASFARNRFLKHIRYTSKLWDCIIKGVIQRFPDPQDEKAFRIALNEGKEPFAPPFMSASRKALQGLKLALNHLAEADKRFKKLAEDPSLETKVSKLLYIKITKEGMGESIQGINRVRLRYVIKDRADNILSAQSNTWINLVETIPGFSHGIQGMRIGENRTLFIHPSLGYGALTTLTPCSELVADIELLEVDSKSTIALPSLVPENFEWLHNPQFQNKLEQSLKLLPEYTGAFYHRVSGLFN